MKCLDVYFDANLSLDEHISHLKKYCFRQLHYLYCLKKHLSTTVKIKLVKSLILSKIDYCNAIFVNLAKYQLKKISRIINSCLRYIYDLKWDTGASLYYLKAHILPVPFEYRLKYKVCLTVFKCLHNIAPVYLADLLYPYASLESL